MSVSPSFQRAPGEIGSRFSAGNKKPPGSAPAGGSILPEGVSHSEHLPAKIWRRRHVIPCLSPSMGSISAVPFLPTGYADHTRTRAGLGDKAAKVLVNWLRLDSTVGSWIERSRRVSPSTWCGSIIRETRNARVFFANDKTFFQCVTAQRPDRHKDRKTNCTGTQDGWLQDRKGISAKAAPVA